MDTRRIITFGIMSLCCFTCESISSINTFYLEDICRWTSPSTFTIKVGDTSSGYNSSGVIKSTRFGYYMPYLKCIVKLEPAFQHGIIIALRKIDFRPGCVDKLKITNNMGTTTEYCTNLYDSTEGKTVKSWGKMTLNFTSASGLVIYEGFQLTFTAYRTEICFSEEYKCKNFRCVSNNLKCDGHNHCGDRSDQTDCFFSVGGIIAVVLACLFFLITVSTVIGCRYRRRNRAARTEMHSLTTDNPSSTAVVQDNDSPPSYGNYLLPTQVNYQIAPQGYYPPPPPYNTVHEEGTTNPGYKSPLVRVFHVFPSP